MVKLKDVVRNVISGANKQLQTIRQHNLLHLLLWQLRFTPKSLV
jgi:hypothetical protein